MDGDSLNDYVRFDDIKIKAGILLAADRFTTIGSTSDDNSDNWSVDSGDNDELKLKEGDTTYKKDSSGGNDGYELGATYANQEIDLRIDARKSR